MSESRNRSPKVKSKSGGQQMPTEPTTKRNPYDRLVVNKLGMKFDPVCWKKNHEKSRVQFVCIEPNCKADRRLACAHCIIEDHHEHVSNKITVEQYCDTFEANLKFLLLQVAKLESHYQHSKMPELMKIVDSDLQNLLRDMQAEVNRIRSSYIEQIKAQIELQNAKLIQLYQQQRVLAYKMKDFHAKNLFEMTPAELESTMVLMGTKHLEQLQAEVQEFDESNDHQQRFVKQQWKIVSEQISSDILDCMKQIQVSVLNFDPPHQREEVHETPAHLLIKMQNQDEKALPETNCQGSLSKESKNSTVRNDQFQQLPLSQYQSKDSLPSRSPQAKETLNSLKPPPGHPSFKKKIEFIKQINERGYDSNQSLQQDSHQQNDSKSNHQDSRGFHSESNSHQNAEARSQKPSEGRAASEVKSVTGLSVDNMQSPLRKNSTNNPKQLTQTNNYYYQPISNAEYKGLGSKSTQNLLPNGQSKHTKGNSVGKNVNTSQTVSICIHDATERALPVFPCCNKAYPCYECHDLQCTHKAHISQPSMRFCPNCLDVFSVNLLSTVDVKCYRCS